MKSGNFAIAVAVLSLSTFMTKAGAQSQPTAVQQLQLSVFGTGTGTWTGLDSGKNLGFTAGVDLGVRLFDKYLPSVELRANYPFVRGGSASAENLLGGVKVERVFFHRYHPYVDFLYGRSEVQFAHGGFPNPQDTFEYTKTPSNTLSFGGGCDIPVTHHFSAKADFQLEREAVPVTTSHHILSKRVGIGVVYRFDFTGHKYFNR